MKYVDPDQHVGGDRVDVQASASSCTRCRGRAQSGQRMPTGVDVMQSGQIGLPQFEHETPVLREGCR